MLTANRPRQSGFTIIEAMVVLVVLGFMLAYGTPALADWIASARVRGAAEATLTGMQYARSEATSRNQNVRFQLTTSLDNSCALSTQGTNWVVDLVEAADDSVEGKCDQAASDDTPTAPGILQKRSAAEVSGNTRIVASQSAVVFTGLGRVAPPPAGDVHIDITPSNPLDCRGKEGDITCLRVVISPAGLVKLCNPDPGLSASNPQKCP